MTTSNTSSAAVQSLCAKFVADLSEVIREEAVANVVNALGGAGVAAAPTKVKAPKAVSTGGKRRGRPPGSVAVKRDPAEQAAICDSLMTHIAANPGQRMEDISSALGRPSKEMAFAVKSLLDGGLLTKEGNKRATTYTVAKKAPKAKAETAAPKAAKPRVKKPNVKRAKAPKAPAVAAPAVSAAN